MIFTPEPGSIATAFPTGVQYGDTFDLACFASLDAVCLHSTKDFPRAPMYGEIRTLSSVYRPNYSFKEAKLKSSRMFVHGENPERANNRKSIYLSVMYQENLKQ